MKVLFLNSNFPDYLAESLFHGLRCLLGSNVVDIPRYDSMYTNLTDAGKKTLRGGGFTLYGLLEDTKEISRQREDWDGDMDKYDIIVFSNIFDQFRLFSKISKKQSKCKIVVLDGSDNPSLFPFVSIKRRIINDFWSFFISFRNTEYFKREYDKNKILWNNAESYIPMRMINKVLSQRIIKPISFSIPAEKIVTNHKSFELKKLFSRHIVDKEVANHVEKSFFSSTGSDQYIFKNESDYYNDLQNSKFGITTKRAGWDCLRHYEIAANGCVICFKNLHLKPKECAPFGLNESNCISYKNYDDLMQKISIVNEAKYNELQRSSIEWVRSMTTLNVAKRFLYDCTN